MKLRIPVTVAVVSSLFVGGAACTRDPAPIVVGAVYPTTGPQAQGGLAEYRGVRLAVDMANALGGVDGRPLQLQFVDTPGSDGASQAVDQLASRGARFVLGSYGSTISLPASQEAARRGMLFWETGAVGDMTGRGLGRLVFRVSPTGATLGRAAVSFVANRLAPLLKRDPSTLRFAVTNVEDVYGRAVARGAVDEIRAMGLTLAGQFPYDLQGLDAREIVNRIAAVHPDVLFASAYVRDAVAIRRETVRRHLHLLASIGTSSSYCMPEFGAALGRDAVGLFASDKPDAGAINPTGLQPSARRLLDRAGAEYQRRYGAEMSAPALAGFSAAWALFRSVMPAAGAMTPEAVAASALRTRLPRGSLPNGSGLAFDPPGSPGAGSNLQAASVIWEWVGVRWREIVWPPSYATAAASAIPLAS